MEEKTNELIVLEQLPIIRATLENLSIEIKEKVDRANNLVVNDETVKEVKQVRANLTKEFNELEAQRKQVKSAIMSKYDEFEEIYRENVSNLYKQADADLKLKIDNVENQLKKDKQEELQLFAKEYFEVNQIEDIVSFDDIGLNITLSASMKSLKEQIIKFCENITSDLKMIETIEEENLKNEVLLEYKRTLDYKNSYIIVVDRHKRLEELQKRKQELEKQKEEEQKMVEVIEEVIEEEKELSAPKEIIEEEDFITITFTITDTKENIIKVREFMKKEGIKYE